jgi:hypothetical protein
MWESEPHKLPQTVGCIPPSSSENYVNNLCVPIYER